MKPNVLVLVEGRRFVVDDKRRILNVQSPGQLNAFLDIGQKSSTILQPRIIVQRQPKTPANLLKLNNRPTCIPEITGIVFGEDERYPYPIAVWTGGCRLPHFSYTEETMAIVIFFGDFQSRAVKTQVNYGTSSNRYHHYHRRIHGHCLFLSVLLLAVYCCYHWAWRINAAIIIIQQAWKGNDANFATPIHVY